MSMVQSSECVKTNAFYVEFMVDNQKELHQNGSDYHTKTKAHPTHGYTTLVLCLLSTWMGVGILALVCLGV